MAISKSFAAQWQRSHSYTSPTINHMPFPAFSQPPVPSQNMIPDSFTPTQLNNPLIQLNDPLLQVSYTYGYVICTI